MKGEKSEGRAFEIPRLTVHCSRLTDRDVQLSLGCRRRHFAAGFSLSVRMRGGTQARIIHDYCREVFEPETRRGLLASKADGGVLAVRRGGRTRTAPRDERIGRRSGYS